MLSFVLRWPMELFDTTPTGRIINRFAKDVDVVDNVLPAVIRSWVMMVFGVIDKGSSTHTQPVKLDKRTKNELERGNKLLILCTIYPYGFLWLL